MIQTLLDFYGIPGGVFAGVTLNSEPTSGATGFFQFGTDSICYGRSRSGVAADIEASGQFDASKSVEHLGSTIDLPFDFGEVIDNLRLERYRQNMVPRRERFATSEAVRQFYYLIRGFLPLVVRRQLQKVYLRGWDELPFPSWPVDFTVDVLHEKFLRLMMEASGLKSVPFIWFWPEGSSSCLIMTHDVETSAGRDFTFQLMNLDDAHAIRASYQVIPEERYHVPDEYVKQIRDRGGEVNVHDLMHDGHLYRKREMFLERAKKINEYVKKFDARGFRAGVMYRRLDWYDAYEFSYDMSVPNVAHLEPQRGGCCTVFPYYIGDILEIPLTTCQDYSLFQILGDYSIELWKSQLDMIRKRNGLMSMITHPDYLMTRRARQVYESLLDHLRELITTENVWATLPGKVDDWWRARSQMSLVQGRNGWEIVGPEAERARIAFATIEGDRLVYEVCAARDRAVVHP